MYCYLQVRKTQIIGMVTKRKKSEVDHSVEFTFQYTSNKAFPSSFSSFFRYPALVSMTLPIAVVSQSCLGDLRHWCLLKPSVVI